MSIFWFRCKLFAYVRLGIGGRQFAGELFIFKGRHFDRSVILLCVRWYLAYGLSLRDLKEMMAERSISVDHSTIHRRVVHFSPLLLERFNRRKCAVTGQWHVDETYINVRGKWMYLYRAIDSTGDTVEFWFSEHRDMPAAKRFFRNALERHGSARAGRHRRQPDQPRGDCLVRCREPTTGPLAARAEADSHPPEPIPQQPHRAGSSAHQVPGATDAGLQVVRERDCNPGRDRDDPNDGQTTGEVRLQSKSVDCGAF